MKTAFSFTICILALIACSQGVSSSNTANDSTKGSHDVTMVTQLEKADSDKVMLIESSSDKSAPKGLFTGELHISIESGFVVTLLITNTQNFGVPVQYRSGMTADLQLIDAEGKKVWAWSDDMMFTQAIRDEVMPAGKVKPVRFKLPKSVLAQVNKKGYRIVATFKGYLTESKGIAMADVNLPLDPYLN